MVNFLDRDEFTSFDVQSYLLVSVTERHTFQNEAVYLFHTKEECIFVIV